MINNANSISSGNTVVPWTPPPASHWLGDSIFSLIIAVSITGMIYQQQTAQGLTNQMTERMKVAREATEMAHLVEAEITKMSAPDAKGTLPESVKSYMENNDIRVEGKTIGEFLASGNLDKGGMIKIKAALETTASAASDFNQQTQLKVQDVMGKYSGNSKMIESLTSMQAELAKGVAAAIR